MAYADDITHISTSAAKKYIQPYLHKVFAWTKQSHTKSRQNNLMNDEVTKADDIQRKWLLMKETWLKGSKQVCRITKGPPRHKETWWWNRDVEKVVAK